MKVWAYVFITPTSPRKVPQALRQIPGVGKADALFGTPDAIAIVAGEDITAMDAVHGRCHRQDRGNPGGSGHRFQCGPLDRLAAPDGRA